MQRIMERYRRRARERRAVDAGAERLYSLAMRQARDPSLYAEAGVPDNFDGRFDLLVLHLWLLLRRLATEPDLAPLQRRLQEVAVRDFDRTLRQIGVGDLGVGRRVRAMARAQAGRFAAYDAAIEEAGAGQLEAALRRNVWRGSPSSEDAVRTLADYVRRQHLYLETQAAEALRRGEVAFAPFEPCGPQRN